MFNLLLAADNPAQPKPDGRIVSKHVMDDKGQWVERDYIVWREDRQLRDRPVKSNEGRKK